MLSESDLILCTKFKFCEEKYHRLIRTYWSTQPSTLWWQTQFQEKCTYLRDGASGVQVGDIEQVTLKILSKIS